jgi:PAS domain S-box-containing protein
MEALIEWARTCYAHAALEIEKGWLALARSYLSTKRGRGQREAALRETEERLGWLASIVEFSDDAIISKQLDGTITSWNKGAERLFGYAAEEAVGKSITMLIPGGRYDEERMILERVGRGEKVEHYETVRERKDGSSIFISLTVSPIKSAEGRIVGASKVARDITDRKHAEAREKMLMAELAHVNRMATAGELSASIAHEINQPLATISFNAEAVRVSLSSKKFDSDVVDALDEILVASHRASEIVKNVKSMFRKDAGDQSEVGINELIRSVIDLVTVDLRKHQIDLKMELDDHLPYVLGNHVQLQQVVLNLVMNAIDAMRSAHVRSLSVSSKLSSRDGVHVSVEDTGIGIDPNYGDKIFEPMFTTKEHGLGMGLCICRSIIEQHGGRIWVSPGVSVGAIFQFELPKRTG